MLGRLRRPFVGDLGGLVATGVPQDPAAQAQGLRMGLEPEGAIERQQRAVSVAQPEGGVPQLVPYQRQVGVRLHRLLERGERLAVALQLDQRRSLERQGERGVAELGARAFGEPERILAPPLTAQQLEALGPAALQVGMIGNHRTVRLLGVDQPSFAGEVAGARHDPLARCVRKQLEGCGRPHGVRI